MRYQERIYAQTSVSGIRNKDILNVNMSSDICIFTPPKFGIDEGIKINCDSVLCSLSGFNPTNILSGGTLSCASGITASCITGTTWETRLYENNNLTYSADFYTSVTSADTPTISSFIESVSTGLNSLDYTYTVSGTTFTIDKKPNIQSLDIDICLLFEMSTSGDTCPVGFSATPENDACVQIITTASTYNGSSFVSGGSTNTVYSNYGTYFYSSVQNDGALPVFYQVGTGLLKNQTGATISPVAINNTNAFWYNSGTTTNGRLNNVGLSASTTEWLGFSYCFDVLTAGTYYIGIAADNYCRFTIDGDLIAYLSATTGENFRTWSVFEFNFTSGKHIIEMEGLNQFSSTAFGAEIYNPTSFAVLTAATSTGASEANVIFSTAEKISTPWDLGETVGYTCPDGYSLDTCSGNTCVKITITGINSTCSGTCSDDCSTICTDDFSYIDNTSTGVFIIDSLTASTIPLTFNFTADTEVFSAYNATFSYEIYKYNEISGVFTVPAVYNSGIIYYSAFSGTNILTQNVPISGLSIDGNYLIKGYYKSDVCTDFLSRLGKKIDTIIYKEGSQYQLYDPSIDYYFIVTSNADVPIFTQTQLSELSAYDALPLYQQVILVDDNSDFVVTEDTSDEIIATGNSYTRSGGTISLNSEYVGDVIVTLNGLSLAKDLDYTLSGTVLTFFGDIENGDIITIVYTRTSTLTIVANTIQIDDTIVSGTTDNQGSNTYYYNTTTNKYEIYLENEPLDFSKTILILNGVTLANNIDYYQSTSNPNRVILSGTLMVGDIITAVYYPKSNVINGITQNSNIINWYIPTPPQSNNGSFYLEYSSESSFNNSIISQTVEYEPLTTNYSGLLSLSGDVGDVLYYRVRNVKDFESICRDTIRSSAVSETVSVTIQSNAINSY